MGWIKNGNGNWNKETNIKEQLDSIELNHLGHLEKGITDLQISSTKILDLLNEIKTYGVKIRK